jgi:hypothetical protein
MVVAEESRAGHAVETALAGTLVGRATAIDDAVQALSAVSVISVCRNLTTFRCYCTGHGTAAVVDSSHLPVVAAAELPTANL